MIKGIADQEVLKASGVRITKCPPANCAGSDTNNITRRALVKERREFNKVVKAERTGVYPVGV